MSYGWQGTGRRALEFPDGAPVGPFVGLAPVGRGRLRYNRALNRFEQSLSGAAYVPFAGGGIATVEFSPAELSKLGGPGATDEVIGSTDVPATRLTASTQLLSTRVAAASGWDTSSDVTLNLALALNGAQANNDTVEFDIDYIYARSGAAALANLNKAITSLSPVLTVTTAEGLVDETLYNLAFTLDRNDATNPYAGETTGGFGVRLNIDAGSSIGSIYVVGLLMQFPTL